MKKAGYFLGTLSASILGALLGVYAYDHYYDHGKVRVERQDPGTLFSKVRRDDAESALALKPFETYFVEAAEKVTPSVVHIKTLYNREGELSPIERMLEDFYGDSPGDGSGMRKSSGSGVIISSNGYIVTNHHVIENAEKVEVVLNDKREYLAAIIGQDPTTDLALIKVEAEDLPLVTYGNSDEVKIGQWVLAVGNPFDLTSTVTAGIISAKARNINILRSRGYAIESFIQTDAAVNPGNSGGALVDLSGHLVGINTAIATETGSYAGYSFAVPVLLVEKVVNDLREYGEVKRALLGVSIRSVDAKLAEDYGLPEVKGVMIMGISEGSGAADAGIAPGSVIYQVDGLDVNSTSELQEIIGRKRPGEHAELLLFDGAAENRVMVLLKDKNRITGELTANEMPPAEFEVESLGAGFAEPLLVEKKRLGIKFGLKIVELGDGLLKDKNVRVGFIITDMNNIKISSKEEFFEEVKSLEFGTLMIEGVYPNGERAVYGLGF